MSGTRLVLIAWLLMSFADGSRLGTFSYASVSLMTAGVLLLALPVAAPERFPVRPPGRWELAATVGALAAMYAPATIVPGNEPDLPRAAGVLFLSLLVGLALLAWKDPGPRLGGVVALVGAGVAGLMMIAYDSPPGIDVWFLTQGAADSIVHGFDMYLGHWPESGGIDHGFPYLPGVGLLLAPFRVVGLDVRHGMLLAALLAAVLVWRSAPGRSGPWLAVLIVAVPGFPTLIAYGWTEPILLLPLALVFVLMRAGRPGWATLAFLVALATKQHVLLVCPVLAAWPAFGLRRVLLAVAGAAALTVPWFLVAPHAFLDGALWLNLHLAPRRDSLSLFTVAMDQGWRPPFALVGTVTLAAMAVVVVRLRASASPSKVGLASAWVLGVFHLVNKQSFYNEWWLTITLLAVALALSGEDQTEPRAAPA